ncbi:hypothetical protein ABPG74_006962 [Tetrahymena malaccensis]
MSNFQLSSQFYLNQNSKQINGFKDQSYFEVSKKQSLTNNQQPLQKSSQNEYDFNNQNQNLKPKQQQFRSQSNDTNNNNTNIKSIQLQSYIKSSKNVAHAQPKVSLGKQTITSQLNKSDYTNRQQNFKCFNTKYPKNQIIQQNFINNQIKSNEKLDQNFQFKNVEQKNLIKCCDTKNISLESKNIQYNSEKRILEYQLQNISKENQNEKSLNNQYQSNVDKFLEQKGKKSTQQQQQAKNEKIFYDQKIISQNQNKNELNQTKENNFKSENLQIEILKQNQEMKINNYVSESIKDNFEDLRKLQNQRDDKNSKIQNKIQELNQNQVLIKQTEQFSNQNIRIQVENQNVYLDKLQKIYEESQQLQSGQFQNQNQNIQNVISTVQFDKQHEKNEEILQLQKQIQEEKHKNEQLKNLNQELQKKSQEDQYKIDTLQNELCNIQKISQCKIEQKNKEINIIDYYSPLQKYDVIINMQSVLDLESSFYNQNVKTESQNQEYLNSCKNLVQIDQTNSQLFDKNLLTVGFLGQIKQGKTFIMNSLFYEQQLTDKYQETKGISMKYHSCNGNNVIYIDSQGRNKPIQMDYDNIDSYARFNEIKNQGKEDFSNLQKLENEVNIRNQFQIVTEQLLQGFIVQYAQILVIVVSNITQDDINFINKIQNNYSLSHFQRQKRVFVIHNLKELQQPEHVCNYIQKLQKIFPLRKQSIYTFKQPEYKQNTIFIDNVNQNVNHLIMAHQNSEAGKEYNKFTIDYLKKEIAHSTLQISFNVVQKFRDYLNQNIKTYLTLKQDQENSQIQKKKDFIEYDEQQQIFRLIKGIRIEKIKYLQANFRAYENQCCYSMVQNIQQNKLYLLVQIPNTASFEQKFVKNEGIFTLKIFQNYELEEQLGTYYISNKKLEEEYQIKICRQSEIYKYNQNQYIDFRNGTHQFVFDKEDNDENDEEQYD